ncbi:hypothetical protein INR49_032333 [Caranx melampygus]|nr:hypothetical protein INR49_032333 [Caranx melampygus]
MRVVCALGLFMTLLHLSAPLLLGAFNIKSFGDKKASNPTLMNFISTIIHRYDIILIQEVRDTDLAVTKKIIDHVNRGSPPFKFKHIVSEPLGPSTYKERYLFLYREQTVDVVQSYTYEDPATAFTRKPFVVMFSSRDTVLKNFVLIPQHTSPKLAVKEVNALYDVVTDVRNCCKTNNIVLLGDFNAGCTYVKRTDWQQIRLFTNKTFHWLITDAADTTVSHSNCPYDRIVVTSDMMKGVVPNSAAVYDYMKALRLSQKEALAVSDHFPVEIIHRYDIILIQEVRDSDLSATKKLMEHVNEGSNFTYKHIVSEPLGRSSYKERYLFLYREQTVSVVQNFTYESSDEHCGTDTFMRKPFVVMFSSNYTVLENFVLIPQHTSPDFAEKEVNALYDVVTDVQNRWKTNDTVVLGDFNAGCNYVSGSDWQQIRLFTDKSFHWLITDEADTTVSHSNCPYDRIVVTSDMMKGVVPNSAAVYDYMEDLGLSHDEALAVSDHFPVEVEMARLLRPGHRYNNCPTGLLAQST